MRRFISLFDKASNGPFGPPGGDEEREEMFQEKRFSRDKTHWQGEEHPGSSERELVLRMCGRALGSFPEDRRGELQGPLPSSGTAWACTCVCPSPLLPPSLLAAPAKKEGTGALGEVGRRGEGAGFGAALTPRCIDSQDFQTEERGSCKWKNCGISSVGLWSGDFNSETTVWLVHK